MKNFDTLNSSCISFVNDFDAFEACNDMNLRAPWAAASKCNIK